MTYAISLHYHNISLHQHLAFRACLIVSYYLLRNLARHNKVVPQSSFLSYYANPFTRTIILFEKKKVTDARRSEIMQLDVNGNLYTTTEVKQDQKCIIY